MLSKGVPSASFSRKYITVEKNTIAVSRKRPSIANSWRECRTETPKLCRPDEYLENDDMDLDLLNI